MYSTRHEIQFLIHIVKYDDQQLLLVPGFQGRCRQQPCMHCMIKFVAFSFEMDFVYVNVTIYLSCSIAPEKIGKGAKELHLPPAALDYYTL